MGKGDIKTRRGKIHRGSYGKTRPHSKSVVVDTEAKPAKKTTAKKKKKKTSKAKKNT